MREYTIVVLDLRNGSTFEVYIKAKNPQDAKNKFRKDYSPASYDIVDIK